MAGLALHGHMDERVAVPVVDLNWRPERRRPPIAPLHERDEGGEEIEALVSQAVLDSLAGAGLSVGMTVEHAVLDEGGKASAQNVPGATQVVVEVGEAAHPVEGLSQHENRPLLSDNLEGAPDGTPLPLVRRGPRLHVARIAAELCK